MKKYLVILATLVLGISITNIYAKDMNMNGNMNMVSDSSSTNSKTQKFCPVMGGEIDTSLYYDYKGKRVYVCCKMCLPQVKKNPQKYIDQLEKKGIELKKVDTK